MHKYITSGLQLCHIPQSRVAWVTSILDLPSDYFAECQGNTLFVPSRSMPRREVDEYKTIEGTRIDGYTPALNVLLWQFGRDWMGQVSENYALLAAPREDVFSVLHGNIYLVQWFDEMMQRIPDDCNIHFRSIPQRERSAFESLLLFLRQMEVTILDTCGEQPAQSFLENYTIPNTSVSQLRKHWGRGDSLMKIEQQPDESLMIRFATIFSVLYGFDTDND